MLQSVATGYVYTGSGFAGRAPLAAQAARAENKSADSAHSAKAKSSSASSRPQVNDLTPQEQQQLEQLKAVDRRVRAHEQAHLSAGAGLVRGGPSFTYQSGPDDRRYAVAGEVSIDTSPAATPQETLVKAQRIRAAALAPADPSAQDQSVAAQAARMAGAARMELAAQQRAAATDVEPAGVRFYRGVAQGEHEARLPGLDLYA